MREALFDVFRMDKKRFFFARVLNVDFDGPVKRICFRFTKTKDNHIEWFDFGSPYICPFRSKVVRVERKKKAVQNNGVNGNVASMVTSIQPTPNMGLAPTAPPNISSALQANESTAPVPPENGNHSSRDVYDFATTLASLSKSENNEIHHVPEGHMSCAARTGHSNDGQSEDPSSRRPSTDLASKLSNVVIKQEDSAPSASISAEKVNYGSTSRNDFTAGYVDLPLQRIYQRPPDFVTHAATVSSFTMNSNQVHSQPNVGDANTYEYPVVTGPTPSSSADWSGLDMLAAVTFDAATFMVSTSSYSNGITPSSTVSSVTASTPCDWSISNSYPHHGYASSLWHAHSYVPAAAQYVPVQHSLGDGHPGRSYYDSMYTGGMNNAHDFSRQPSSNNGNSNSNKSRYG
jgi:hypothetical protein